MISRLARVAILLPLTLSTAALNVSASAQSYVNHLGVRVRSPHVYRRHPNRSTRTTAVCRDGAVSFSLAHRGTCSHHGGVDHWQ